MSEYDDDWVDEEDETNFCERCGDELDNVYDSLCTDCCDEEEFDYPDNSITGVKLELIGQDGNAFSILGRASRALKNAKKYDEFWGEYEQKATSGDYNVLLATTMEYFNVH